MVRKIRGRQSGATGSVDQHPPNTLVLLFGSKGVARFEQLEKATFSCIRGDRLVVLVLGSIKRQERGMVHSMIARSREGETSISAAPRCSSLYYVSLNGI